MPNPYPTIATNLTAQSVDVLAAFTNAQAELGAQGCADATFLEIGYLAGKIVRLWDGAQINSLTPGEQWNFYPQLGGLFNLAMNNKLYP